MKILMVEDEEVELNSLKLLSRATTLDKCVAQFEANLISKALTATNGNKAKAAELLGVPASTLKSKIRKYGI